MIKKIFTEGPSNEWLKAVLFGPLNARRKDLAFEHTARLSNADIIFSGDIEKLKKHLRGRRWKGTLVVLLTDHPQNPRTKTWNGKAYIEISTRQLGLILLVLRLRQPFAEKLDM
jgi:hypothetical protein